MADLNNIENLDFARPDPINFLNTLISCGYDVNSVDFFMHFLSWKTKVKGTANVIINNIPMRYFESPDIFFLVFTQFSTYTDNYFAEWLRMVMNGLPSRISSLGENTALNNIDNNIITYMNQQALERIRVSADPTNYVDDEDTSPEAKKWNQARNLFKKHFLSYMRHVASWPLNTEENLFSEYQDWLGGSLLIRPGSELHLEFINIYRKMEASLASLTNYKMNGEGLVPMSMNFHYKDDITSEEDMKDQDVDVWKAGIQRLRREYEDLLDKYEIKIKEKKEIDKQIKQEVEAGEDRDIVEDRYDYNNIIVTFERLKVEYENARERLDKYIYNSPWTDWPANLIVKVDNAIIDRWYAWASQFWLQSLHSKWFQSVGKMSRSNDTSNIFRATQITLIDDSSAGNSRFCRFALSVINMPQLIYVYTLRNDSPWWRPPEISWEDIRTDAEVDVENISLEKDRIDIIHRRLQNIKESLSEGFLSNGNVVLYTTSNDLVGYCLINDISIVIFNNWMDQSAIDISSLREQIVRQTGLLGQMVTQMVPETTLLLTYVVLMALSCSSGIALYVTFGWENIFKQWYGLVKEYQKLVPPNKLKPGETCAWLARYGNGNRIILNKNLLTPLILRLLQSKFAPDKAPIKLGSAYNVWSSRYSDLIEENRISSGRVQPVAIPRFWNPNIDFLYLSREHTDEDFKKEVVEKEKEEKEGEEEERLRERQKIWKDDLEDYIRQKKAEWDVKRMKAENEYELENTRQRKPWLNLIDVNERKSQDIQREIRDLQNNIDLGEQEVNEKKELLTTLKKQLIDLRKKQDEYDASQSSGSWNLFGGVVNPSSQIDQIIRDKNNLEAQIKRQEEENDRYNTELQKLKTDRDAVFEEIILLKKNPPYDANEKMTQWVNDNPPPQDNELLDEFEQIEGDMPDGVPQIDVDELKNNLNDSPLDLFDMDAIIEMERRETVNEDDDDEFKAMKNDVNNKIARAQWKDKVEWMYAQRQIFQSEYYAPTSIEDLLLKFRIRFKDWTGAETITINN